MKKSYLFLLASAVLALSACGNTTSSTTTGTNTDETTQTTQDNTSSSSSNDTTTSNPVTYRVMVNAATGVTAQLRPGADYSLSVSGVSGRVGNGSGICSVASECHLSYYLREKQSFLPGLQQPERDAEGGR